MAGEPSGRSTARVGGIDGLRALAAFSILVYHGFTADRGAASSGALGALASHLDVGVSVFFVISGFVLYRPFARAHVRGSAAPVLRDYAVRRLLRIVPGFWVALAVSALVIGLDDVFSWTGLTYFGFLHVYTLQGSGGLSQAWSLDVEITFYAVLPLLALAPGTGGDSAARARRAWRLVLGLGAFGLAYLVGVTLGLGLGARATWFYVLPTYASWFAAGMALALAATTSVPRALAAVRDHVALAWAAAAGLYVVVAATTGSYGAERSALEVLALYLAYLAIATLVVAPIALAPREPGVAKGVGAAGLRLLASPLLRYGGVVSYGVYLYHPLGYDLVRRLDLGVGSLEVRVLAATVVTAGLASLSWFLVERPAIRLGERLSGGPRPTVLPADPLHGVVAVGDERW